MKASRIPLSPRYSLYCVLDLETRAVLSVDPNSVTTDIYLEKMPKKADRQRAIDRRKKRRRFGHSNNGYSSKKNISLSIRPIMVVLSDVKFLVTILKSDFCDFCLKKANDFIILISVRRLST